MNMPVAPLSNNPFTATVLCVSIVVMLMSNFTSLSIFADLVKYHSFTATVLCVSIVVMLMSNFTSLSIFTDLIK